MTCVALIPARGGSKGIPKKNIKLFNSKPLIYWSIKVALECKRIDRVIVSTESEEIANIARSLSAEVPFMRPKKYATDDSPGIEPVIHLLKKIPDIDDLLLLQPTSPLRRLKDVEAIFEERLKFKADSAVSITPSKKNIDLYFSVDENQRLSSISKNLNIQPRQKYAKNYCLNGSLYLSTRDSILANRSLITSDTVGYVMPEEYSIDIDTPLDWKVAEHLMFK